MSIQPGPDASLSVGANEIAVTVTAEDGTTTKTYTVTVRREGPALTASFLDPPERHAGSGTFSLRVLFSEPVSVSYSVLRDQSLEVTNGGVSGARRVNGRDDLWEIVIAPSSDAEVTVALPAMADCAAPAAVCTEDGRPLSQRLEAVVPGPSRPEVSIGALSSPVTEGTAAEFTVTLGEAAAEALTVSVSVTESGSVLAEAPPPELTFAAGETSMALSVPTAGDAVVEGGSTVTATVTAGTGYAVGAASSAAVTVEDDDAATFTVSAAPDAISEGESTTLTVAIANGVTFAEDQTVVLAASSTALAMVHTGVFRGLTLVTGESSATVELLALNDQELDEAETVTITASHGGTTIGSATVTIAASEAALTAQFLEMPKTHDGETAFAFELRFSEEIEISYVTLRDTAIEVTGGSVTGARRLAAPSNRRWEITVQPASEADVALVLPVTADCGAVGAICTASGRKLSRRLEATVEGPSEVESAGFSLAPENSRPSGIWSDGQTAWVADLDDARLYAYRRSDGEREPDRDMATAPAPMGLWSDGQTLWVAGLGGGLRAHRLADGSRLPTRDLALGANTAPAGVWSDGQTAWVADWLGDTVHAYRLADGRREAGRDIRLAGGNLLPVGLWSDGQTLWVADWRERLYAYRLADGEREPNRDVIAGVADTDPTGLWSDTGRLLATGWEGGAVRAYRLPALPALRGVPDKGRAGLLAARAASLPAIADPALEAAIEAALGKAPGETVSPQELAGLAALAARNWSGVDLVDS